MGTLYLVEWVSNPDDLALRARRVLGEASLVLYRAVGQRDARAAQTLLQQCQCHAPLIELRELDADGIFCRLRNGDVAWLEPTLELPAGLIGQLAGRQFAGQGVDIVPVPGAVDIITALALSGLPADRFSFFGCLPTSAHERRAALQQAADERHTLVWTVSAANWPAARGDFSVLLGDRRTALIGLDLVWRGRLDDLPTDVQGQVTLVIDGVAEAAPWTEEQVRQQVCRLARDGLPARDIAREVAAHSGWPRRKVYAMVLHLDRNQ